MISKMFLGTAALAALAAAVPASAVVSSGVLSGGTAFTNGGVFVNLGNTPGAITVGTDTNNSSNVFAFNEKQRITLLSNLSTNLGGTIAKGTVVSSQYLFFDAPTRSQQTAIGSVVFNTKILGVLFTAGKVGSTSAFFGNAGVTYTTPNAFALESHDFVSFTNKTLSFKLINGLASDNFRVITAAVPEPATWGMMLAGFGLVGAATRRRRGFATIAG